MSERWIDPASEVTFGQLAYWEGGWDESGEPLEVLGDVPGGGGPCAASNGGVPGTDGDELQGDELVGLPSFHVDPARSTNRQVANRHWDGTEGEEDTADWGWLVSWDEGKLDHLRQLLVKAQLAAQGDDIEGAVVRIGGLRFLVRPGGARIGGLYFAWVLEREGWRVSLMDRAEPFGKTPNVRIHVGALPLLHMGLQAAYQVVRFAVESFGATIQGEKLSRIDPCLDLLGVGVGEFVGPFVLGQVVRRGRKCGLYMDGLAWTGFHVGQGAIRLRVYDKVAECEGSGAKWDAMVGIRWKGEVPNMCTRVEYQLRRKVLKEFEVESVADWIEKRGPILDYLNSEWFRLTEGAVDRENSQRCGPSDLWQMVTEGFASWAGVALLPAERVRLSRKLLDIGVYVRQAIGCFTSAAAVRGRSLMSFGDVLRFMHDQAELFGDELEQGVLKRFKRKRIVFEAQVCC